MKVSNEFKKVAASTGAIMVGSGAVLLCAYAGFLSPQEAPILAVCGVVCGIGIGVAWVELSDNLREYNKARSSDTLSYGNKIPKGRGSTTWDV